MFICKELNREFETKAEMFEALRCNHTQIIEAKRAQIYNTKKGDNKGGISICKVDFNKFGDQIKELSFDSDYYYLAVNTTKILDSHRDLHMNGIWKKTTKDQQGKVYLVWDHEYCGSDTIVRKEYIEIIIAEIPFAALGKPYAGNTEALIYKFRKDKVIDLKAKEWLGSGDVIEASVRMQYVEILFALDSKEEEDKEFKKNYDKYYPEIANKEDYNGIEYFWPVLQAKNVLESSLVLSGSNSATGLIIENNKYQPSEDTENKDNEPSVDTQLEFYKQFNS